MKITKADKILIVIVVVIAVAGIVAQVNRLSYNGQKYAEISVDGKLVKTLPLKEGIRAEYRIGGEKEFNIIEIENEQVRVVDADCPDRLCVRTGWVSLPTQQIVCLPYRVVVKIVSEESADVDDIAR